MMATHCLEYLITVNNVSVLQYTWIKKGTGTLTFMASLFRGPVYGLCPSGVQGQSPWWEVKGEATRPQKLKAFEMYAANLHSKILCAYIGKISCATAGWYMKDVLKIVGNTLQESFVRLSTTILSHLSY